jgi:tetratricopeptide (TPR) repeat protein
VYKQTSLLLVLLLGCLTPIIPSAVQAQTLVAQGRSAELKQMLEDGRRLVNSGDLGGALSVYQQAATLESRNAKIHSAIGYIYAQQGNFPAALTAYRKAIAIDGNNSDFYYAVGYIKGNMGDTPGAKEAYRKAIQLNRNNLNAYLGLGVTQSRLGDYESSMWAFEQAVNLNGSNAQTFELLGSTLKQRGKAKDATRVLKKARDLYERRNDNDGVGRVEGLLRGLGA